MNCDKTINCQASFHWNDCLRGIQIWKKDTFTTTPEAARDHADHNDARLPALTYCPRCGAEGTYQPATSGQTTITPCGHTLTLEEMVQHFPDRARIALEGLIPDE